MSAQVPLDLVDDRPLLNLAAACAQEIVEADVRELAGDEAQTAAFAERLAAGDVEPHRLMAHAYVGLMERFIETMNGAKLVKDSATTYLAALDDPSNTDEADDKMFAALEALRKVVAS